MKSKCKSSVIRLLSVVLALILVIGAKTQKVHANLTDYELKRDETKTSAELSVYNNIYLNGHKLTVNGNFDVHSEIRTGQYGELIVTGDLTTYRDIRCEKSGKITVNGNYTQRDGGLSIEDNAKVTVDKDLSFTDTGFMHSGSSTGSILVGGACLFDTTNESSFWSKLTVKGDFRQADNEGKLSINNLLYMNGTEEQTLELLGQQNYISKLKTTSTKLHANKIWGPDLESDVVIEPIGGKFVFGDASLNGHKMTVNGDMEEIGHLTVAKNSVLTVEGNYTQTDDYFSNDDNSNTIIKGNMVFTDTGCILNCSFNANIRVDGDFVYNSSAYGDINSDITVSGDVLQSEDAANIRFDGVLILNGTEEQKIEVLSSNRISNLKSTNDKLKMNKLWGTQLKSDVTLTAIDGKLEMGDMSLDGYKLAIAGDVKGIGDVFVTANSELTITGSYTQDDGSLNVEENAVLSVGEDLSIVNTSFVYEGDPSGNIVVGGDFTFDSTTDCKIYDQIRVLGDFKQGTRSGEPWFSYVYLPNKNSSVALTNGEIDTLKIGSGKADFTISPADCYKKLIATVTLTFDANGGTVTPGNKSVTTFEKYGELPVPEKNGQTFVGWSTKKENGELVKADTEVTAVDDLTVYAVWAGMKFNDVKATAWYYSAVEYAYTNGIMAGTGEAFKPNDPLTREQFTQVLYNHKGKPEVNYTYNFPDVKDAWYKKSVLWAKQNNIANGKGDGTFGVGLNITREELALMLYKYAALCGFDTSKTDGKIDQYADYKKVSSWAKDAMNWAVTQGIMSGKGDKNADISTYKLDPQGKATRAECASMMKKLLEKNEQ